MWSFIGGWRRKTGVVILALAGLLAVGWNRSLKNCDVLNFPIRRFSSGQALSLLGSVTFDFNGQTNNRWLPERYSFLISDFHRPITDWYDTRGGPVEINWRWRGFGKAVVLIMHDPEDGETIPEEVLWTIPYWSVVVPLTLLSAWLLLSKPRQEKSFAEIRPR